MEVFEHPNRASFFRKMGLKWWNVCPIDEDTGLPLTKEEQPYGMYRCQKIPSNQIAQIKAASADAGRVIRKVWDVVKGLEDDTLLDLGFPPESLKVIKSDKLTPFTMRLDWSWNKATQEYKIIEINCQTPSFLFECLAGNKYAAEYFGLEDPNPEAIEVARDSLRCQLVQAAASIGKHLSECTVAFTALNNVEDMGTMHWLAQQAKCVVNDVLLFPLEFLKVVGDKRLRYIKSDRQIDILFMWYPLEWAIYDRDEQGNLL